MKIFEKIKYYNGKRECYLFNILLFTYYKKTFIRRIKNHVEYFKSLGVKIGENTKFTIYPTLDSFPNFGSEPYLIEIGDNCLISFLVTFLTHDGSINTCLQYIKNKQNLSTLRRIKIGNNCFIGCHSIILPGVTIGNNSIIGAGSVVTKNVPDGEVWAGNPAKFIKTTKELAQKIENESKNPENIEILEYYLANKYHF